jgi:hypothetical protein
MRGGKEVGWRCGACRMLITSIEDGWVEWLAAEENTAVVRLQGLRLVHRSGCRYDFRREFHNNGSIVEGLFLERLVGPDRLMQLLALLAAGEMPKDDLLELTKRVQIPGYEQARELFQQAGAGVVTPDQTWVLASVRVASRAQMGDRLRGLIICIKTSNSHNTPSIVGASNC